jgi:hypothetical protein
MAKATEDVLAFRHFPPQHWKKIWSTNLLERVNEEIKRRTRVVGIFPNDAAIERLVGAVLLEQDEHWQLEGRRSSPPRAWPRFQRWRTCRRRPACRKQAPEPTASTQAPGELRSSEPTGRSGGAHHPGAGS